jgi:predicted RNase H-like nuclease
MPILAGIDGCKAGWLCVIRDTTTGRIQVHLLPHIRELLALKPGPNIIAIDIPIGLPDSGPRNCDREARQRLGTPRGSSVFSAPIRPMLRATSYEQACRIGERVDGRKISRQTWNILPKIREVDEFLRGNSDRRFRIHEVHPELCFWYWNGNCAMQFGKKSKEGRAEREVLVRDHYGDADILAPRSLPRGFANDDLLDSFAALGTAERIAAGTAIRLPNDPIIDSVGLMMEIVV